MISIRCSSEDENLIKKFAAIKKQSVSEFLRQAALEKIEDEYDLKLVKDYLEKKEKMSFYSADEVEKVLDTEKNTETRKEVLADFQDNLVKKLEKKGVILTDEEED